ncbi:glycosyltransferase family 9 protein [Amnibacterium setariae]|uniref:Glycosyltransferase family 9 protein n=1 Tax=Amnibacterium setariae TaxID=2306585 RepID=A0A3A1TZ78_9MICO|nr:glycosyltransferase family 9 protein [Amnibacterium setariae]RIX30025.1 glycosyltransferase family 9 protein [Amnibacterium setariae]
MGDVIMSGPAVRAVAAREDTEVWYLAGPRGRSAAALLPGVDELRVVGIPWITAVDRPVDAALVAEVDAIVAECRPDEAIILTAFHQSPLPMALLLRLAGVPRILGASVEASAGLLDERWIPGEAFPEDIPEPERNLAIVRLAGYELPEGDDGRLHVDLPAERPAVLEALPEHYVVVHPGAQYPAREYPADHFAEVVRLLGEAGHAVAVTGGDHETALTAQVAGATGVDLGGVLDLGGTALALAGAQAVIVGNTGPAHLAAAVGRPIVSLFSAVVPPERWAPYGVPLELLGQRDAACRGTRATLCPVPGHPCLTSVRPDQVVAAAERLLALG